jgi:hypothetical protein
LNVRTPTIALTWEIWRHNRVWAVLTAGLLLAGSVAVLMLPYESGTSERREAISMLYGTIGGLAMLFVFGMFHYTDLDPQTGSMGFPRRVFALPLSSLHLVAVPLLLGVASLWVVNAVLSAWHGDFSIRSAVGLGAFMVVYQTILWTCARIGSMRAIFIGIAAIWFLYMGFGGMGANSDSQSGARNILTIAIFVAVGVAAFLVSWLHVARQRCGGKRRRMRPNALMEAIADALPRRTRDFHSASSAQVWLEWRRSGVVLPTVVAGILLLLIAPFAWYLRSEADVTLRILVVVLAMPPMLALPVGKGLSKPDFWTKDLGLPPFLAVRPLSDRDFITIKMKVALLSSAVAWLLTFVFLAVWLSLIANLAALKRVLAALHSLFGGPSYAVALLFTFALFLLTWRFLVGGLWVGLSGSRKLFGVSAAPYVLTPVFAFFALMIISRRGSLIDWAIANADNFLPMAAWVLIVVCLIKFFVAAPVTRQIGWQYFTVWFTTTLLLVVLALLLSDGLGTALPRISSQLQNVLVLVALLFMPLARLGLASSFFEKNRHR